jgi:hypothetical protein
MPANSIRTNTPRPPSPITPLQLSRHIGDDCFDNDVVTGNGHPILSKPKLSLNTNFASSLLITAEHRAKQAVVNRDSDDPDSPETPETPPGCGEPDTPPSGQRYPPGHPDACLWNVKDDCEGQHAGGAADGNGNTATSGLLTAHAKILAAMLSMQLTTPPDSPIGKEADDGNGYRHAKTGTARMYRSTQRWEANVSRKVVEVHQNGESVRVLRNGLSGKVMVVHQ